MRRIIHEQQAEIERLRGLIEGLAEDTTIIVDSVDLKGQSRRFCFHHARALLQHIEDLKAVGFKQLITLASWAEPIAAMWRFRKSNSITEGFHRK